MQRRSLLAGLAGCLAAGFAPAAVGSNVLMPVRKIITKSVVVPYRNMATIRRPQGVALDGRGWDLGVRNADGSHTQYQADDLWIVRPEATYMDVETFSYKFYQ